MYYDYDNQWYIEYTKLSNGQTAMIVFDKYEKGRTIYYSVAFGIANKKKDLRRWFNEQNGGNVLDNVSTGNCGAEGLLWAFHKIESFIEEKELLGDSKSMEYKVIVQATDSRRWRIYKYFLKRLGFVEERDPLWGVMLVRKLKGIKNK